MLYFILSAVLVAVDQLVKLWVRGSIPVGGSVDFLPGVMDLTYLKNTGAAFSILTEHTWILTLVSLAASVVIVVLIAKKVFTKPLGQLALSLVLAGAVGNLIDRAFLGFVTDMFRTTFVNFAIFNVADICVVVGGVLVCVYAFVFLDKQPKKDAPHDPA